MTAAVGSPNAVALPIIVMQTLCEHQLVNQDYEMSSSKCFNEATAMLFVYSIGWHIMFWSIGYPILMNLKEKDTVIISTATTATAIAPLRVIDTQKILKPLKLIVLHPCMVAIYVGTFIGCVPSLQALLFPPSAALRPLGSAVATLGEPLICCNCLIMASSLMNAVLARWRQWKSRSAELAAVDGNAGTSSPLHHAAPSPGVEEEGRVMEGAEHGSFPTKPGANGDSCEIRSNSPNDERIGLDDHVRPCGGGDEVELVVMGMGDSEKDVQPRFRSQQQLPNHQYQQPEQDKEQEQRTGGGADGKAVVTHDALPANRSIAVFVVARCTCLPFPFPSDYRPPHERDA